MFLPAPVDDLESDQTDGNVDAGPDDKNNDVPGSEAIVDGAWAVVVISWAATARILEKVIDSQDYDDGDDEEDKLDDEEDDVRDVEDSAILRVVGDAAHDDHHDTHDELEEAEETVATGHAAEDDTT